MADKLIGDLQLISSVTSGLSVPADDGIQSYRFTAAQMKAFILANGNITLAMLESGIFHGLSSVTPASDDYVTGIDTSDSNNTKKFPLTSFAFQSYRAISNPSSSAILMSDSTVKITGTTGSVVLPTAVGCAGKRFTLIHGGNNFVAYPIATTSSQTVGGIADGAYKLLTSRELVTVESNNVNWDVVGRYAKTPWVDNGAITITATTSSPTKSSTVVTDKLWWRRDGKDCFCRFNYRQGANTSAAAGTGDYLFALPANIPIDSNIITFNTAVEGATQFVLDNMLGAGQVGNSSQNVGGIVMAYDANNFRLGAAGSGSAAMVSSAVFGLTGTTCMYTGVFDYPVVDWQP